MELDASLLVLDPHQVHHSAADHADHSTGLVKYDWVARKVLKEFVEFSLNVRRSHPAHLVEEVGKGVDIALEQRSLFYEVFAKRVH